MRLIDADELKKVIHSSSLSGNREWLLMDLDQIIDNAPTVHHPNCDICEDKAKSYSMGFQDGYLTGKERPQGEWIYTPNIIGLSEYEGITCSICGDDSIGDFNFCPNCGADMRGNGNEVN